MAPKAQVLSGAQKRYLRSLAHSLDPVVQIGKSGLSKGVLAQIDEALLAHELIKVKLGKEAPLELGELGTSAEGELGATVAQTIGRIAILYRRHPDKPKISIPKRGDKAKVDKSKTPPAKAPSRDRGESSSWLTERGNDDGDDFDDEESDDE